VKASAHRDTVQSAIPRHVVQRGNNDCAIATVARLANETYVDAAERSAAMIGSRGLSSWEVHRMLVASTGVTWFEPRDGNGWLRPIAHIAKSADPLLALIRRPWRWRSMHWVAVQRGWIHDPALPRRPRAESYPRRHWRTIMVLRPESALRLMFVQYFRS
jgi:hypothetical protein